MLRGEAQRPQADGTESREPDFADLYQSEISRITRYFNRRVGSADEAADMAQEVFLRFWKIASNLIVDAPEAYLSRIATNLLRDRGKRGSLRYEQTSEDDLSSVPSPEPDPHREVDARREVEHYQRVLSKLTPRTLQIFTLQRVDGLTYRQIGKRLGISEDGVKDHMRKAIAHIARARSHRR